MTLFQMTPVLIGRGGIAAAGNGWNDPRSWLITAIVLALLILLTRWTLRPPRRRSRRGGPDSPTRTQHDSTVDPSRI